MPWRGPEVPGEFPTLGYLVGEWIEAHCVIPDGDHIGDSYLLTEEMWRFLLWFYRLDPDTGRFVYVRGGQLVRPQKWGKGPFASAIICAEAEGPTIPAGWDADGEPVGRPWTTPWIQVAATAEDQTDNVWRSLQPMIELGDLAAEIPDTGKTRINLAGGGLIEPVTSKAGTRLGQRITFAVQDETHGWLPNTGGRALADTQRRNVAGMGGRWLETTNAWDPNQQSVAQDTAEEKAADVYRDQVEPPSTLRLEVQRDRRKILNRVYGDSWWVDKDRIESEVVALMTRDPGQAQRYFANRVWTGEKAWMDEEQWKDRAHPEIHVAPKTQITVGFDGSFGTAENPSRKPDATCLGGCRIDDGHLFTLNIWEPDQPDIDGLWDWHPPRLEIHKAVAEVFATYDVVLMWADPPGWQNDIGEWAQQFGVERVIERWTNSDVWMAKELDRLHTAVLNGDVTHDGDEDATRHVLNAQRYVKRSQSADPDGRRERVLVTKKHRNSPEKIDMVPTWVLAYAARAHVLEKSLHVRQTRTAPLYTH